MLSCHRYVEHLKTQNRILEEQLRSNEQRNRETTYASSHESPRRLLENSWNATSDGDTATARPTIASPNVFMAPMPVTVSRDLQAASIHISTQPTQESPSRSMMQDVPSVSTPSTDGDGSASRSYFGESSTFDFMKRVFTPSTHRHDSPIGRRNDEQTTGASLPPSTPAPNLQERLFSSITDDPLALPIRHYADQWVNQYFADRHPLHPYLHEHSFRLRYKRVWMAGSFGGEDPTENSMAWLGLLNMLFVFGQGEDSRSLSGAIYGRARYFKRAQTLVFSALLHEATVELVQALLLMGHYLHNDLQLNNCWTVVGLAIRTAQGLGLHLSAEDQGFGLIEREIRKRTWWGCFMLDRLLSAKVGRQPTIDEKSTSVELPLAVDDAFLRHDSSRTTLATQSPNALSTVDFFRSAIAQARLVGRIIESMYGGDRHQGGGAASKVRESLTVPEVLAKSIQLDGELTTWQSGLPRPLQFEFTSCGTPYERQGSVLFMR